MACAYPRLPGGSVCLFAVLAITLYQVAAENQAKGDTAQSAPAASLSRSKTTYPWLQEEKDDSPAVRRLRSKIQLLAESVDSFAAGHHKQLPQNIDNSEGGLVDAGGQSTAGVDTKGAAGALAGADSLQLPAPGTFQGGVSDWIRQVVLPNLRKTTEAMQAEVDKAENTVKDCSSTMFNAENQVEHAEKLLQGDEAEKFRCLAAEHRAAKEEKAACDAFENRAKLIVETAPAILTNRSATSVGEHINEHFHFADHHFAEFEDLEGMCEQTKTNMDDKHKECEADEATIEAFYCHMKAGRDAACAKYAECYTETIANFNKVVAKIKILDGHVVDHFKNVACFSSGVGAEREQQDCDQVLIDKSEEQLEVAYPAAPMQEECVHIMKTRRDYSNITCNGDQVVKPAPEPEKPQNKTAGNKTAGAPTYY